MMHKDVWMDAFHHDGSPLYLLAEELTLGGTVKLRVRAGNDAPIERVYLRTAPDGEQHLQIMQPAPRDAVSQWWEADLKLTMPLMHYRFIILAADQVWHYNAAGFTAHTPADIADFKILADYDMPEWVHTAVFYQIFPDRFADGDPSNNVTTGEYQYYDRDVLAKPWGALDNEFRYGQFTGGDLPGITQKMDYLVDLGITAVYLNPVFTSPSSHKYDVSDYFNVDPHFGGNEALIDLRKKLDEHDMHLMLDLVPNHCSSDHPWFTAAQADINAPTAEYFTFHNHPNDYESWLGVRTLPKLNYNSQSLREVMYEGRDAAVRYWLRNPFRVDAWRVDVANMLARQGEFQLGHEITRAFRRAIKEEKPDTYLLGENFFDGSAQLQGDEYDATMNYRGFMYPVLHWLKGREVKDMERDHQIDHVRLSTESMIAQWEAFRSLLPWQITLQQLNLLGSHDTPRVLSIMNGDLDLTMVAVTLLFTYPGVPCIYYGDEIGLRDDGESDSRQCMVWEDDAWNHYLRDYYKRLIQLRRNSSALREGSFQVIYAADHTVAFLRESASEKLVIVARRGHDGTAAIPIRHAGLADGATLQDVLTDNTIRVSGGLLPLLNLPRAGAQIWRVGV